MNEFGKQLKTTADKISYADKKFYERFTSEFTENNKLSSLSHDRRFIIECKQKKLKSMGVDLFESLTPLMLSEITGTSFVTDKYTLKRIKRNFKRKIHLKAKNNKSFEKKQYILFESDILFANAGCISDNEELCCPVCGEISRQKKMESGCEKCGKQSFITHHFPKVKNLFYKKNLSISIEYIGKILFIFCILGLLFSIPVGISEFIETVSKKITQDTIMTSISNVFTAPFKGIMIGVVVTVLIILIRIIYYNIKQSALVSKTNDCKTSIGKTMLDYEKKFSYEDFESEILSLLELIVYNDEREGFVNCKLKKPVRKFDIVDMVYSGFMDLKSIHTENHICEISLDVYMSDIHYNNKSFTVKDDIFSITVHKRISLNNDIGFEMKNAVCPICKDHFDAYTHMECTFCGKEYDLNESYWTVTDIELK